jgi:NADPH:quinone reductase-like Zn-dependent oxidoreductase
MPLAIAAIFSVAAQTCASMIRKLDVKRGMRCLVTAASSNTSLFALAMLRQNGVETYALTTGLNDFAALGVRGTIRLSSSIDESLSSNEIALKVIREQGGFDLVIDPFADVYAASVIRLLRYGGKYITCGIHAQIGMTPEHPIESLAWRDLLAHAITNNLAVFANCLGTEGDLQRAIRDWRPLTEGVPVGGIFREVDSHGFLAAALSNDRFGKVVLDYQPAKRSDEPVKKATKCHER